MQRYTFKILVIALVFILTLIYFPSSFVYATEENNVVTNSISDEVVAGNSNNVNENVENNNEVGTASSQENVDNSSQESHEDDVYSTEASENSVTNSVTSTPTSTKTINSYSTYSTLPEANLGLNNILNVILIAIGVIIILLAIAILIRLKQ